MKISGAQIAILELAFANNGFFDPSMSSLHGSALSKVITALQKKTLLGHETKQGYPITPTGKEALGIISEEPTPQEPRKGSKTEKLINMLRRKKGATNKQIQAALNWQAHSVRGVISILRSKKHYDISKVTHKNGTMAYVITS
ncbi:hypothetical protein MNBD_GAMMA10-1105 [hydrothermal vent metagenome]|uniref:DUF3489 domain-containing protein n=1 Tax=hydrothermal vent metagenome TaxID=652676 RepID=A0A3B0YM02_9ZZZZ